MERCGGGRAGGPDCWLCVCGVVVALMVTECMWVDDVRAVRSRAFRKWLSGAGLDRVGEVASRAVEEEGWAEGVCMSSGSA